MPRPTPADIAALLNGGDLHLISFPLAGGQVAQKLDALGKPMVDERGEAIAGPPTSRWHPIALEGEWEGHHQGPFKLTRRDLEQMEFLFRSLSNDTLVDYEHNTYSFFAMENPAAGWITDMELREGDEVAELWALIDWTAHAAARIDAREYLYMSPAIQWSTTDRKTGKDLGVSVHTVALTNNPFLDELPELSLNSSWIGRLSASKPTQEKTPMDEKQLIQLATMLGLPVTATAEQCIAACTSQLAELSGLEQVAAALKCEGASADVLVASVNGLNEQIVNLSAKAAEVDKIKAEQGIAKARAEGKITAANDKWATDLAHSNLSTFEGWASTATPVVGATPIVVASTEPASTGDVEADVKRLCANPEVIALAKRAKLKGGVEAYVRPNVEDLLKDFG